MRKTDHERFWEKVNKTDTCWLWTGALSNGYGTFGAKGKSWGAHRYSYLLVAEIPEGLHLDHLCRVRNCVNPEHLEPVTCKENIHRGIGMPFQVNAAKTHCDKGHEFTPENTTLAHVNGGGRKCKACQAALHKAWSAKRVDPEHSYTEDLEDYYPEARRIVIEQGRSSTSFLQRKLKIGYIKATQLQNLLHERGVVGPKNGPEPREVLIKSIP